LLFLLVLLLAVAFGLFVGSTFDKLGEDEWRVVVVGGAFVVIVGLGPVCCLSDCCWFGCGCCDDRGRVSCLSLLLIKSLCMEPHYKPSCAVVGHDTPLEKHEEKPPSYANPLTTGTLSDL